MSHENKWTLWDGKGALPFIETRNRFLCIHSNPQYTSLGWFRESPAKGDYDLPLLARRTYYEIMRFPECLLEAEFQGESLIRFTQEDQMLLYKIKSRILERWVLSVVSPPPPGCNSST